MKITNVEVERGSPHAEYALMWESAGARYHVWLCPDDKSMSSPILFKNAPLRLKRGDAGFFETRRLKMSIAKNKLIVDDAMAEAVAGHLFEQCDQKLADAEKERLAKNAAEYKVTLAEKAGPKMLEVLRAIAEFWSDEQKDFPLSPGALILPAFNQNTIRDAVRAAVAEAEGHGT